ncbi:MAG: hypothetical protein ACI7YS_03335 [Flavobacterium sp.]
MLKKLTILLAFIITITSCSLKHTRAELNSGNYDFAIQKAVKKLRANKNASGNQEYVYILEEAFAKAKQRDLQNINNWYKEVNPVNAEKIYNAYIHLNDLQEMIKPLLPLRLKAEKRNAHFPFEDYSDQIIDSKNALSKFLYDNSKSLLASNDKMNSRKAYDDLVYLNSLNGSYKDSNYLMEQAKYKGTDFVIVSTKNETNMVIPARLQNDLLDFNTYGLNDKWTVYHSSKLKTIPYDYGLVLNFREINISPEQIKEREFYKEKQIKDGTKALLDEKGNPVKDSKGKTVMVDNLKTVKATIYESRQFKTVQVVAKVDYLDFRTNQLLSTFPLTGGFTFEHIFSRYNGDKYACESDYFAYFDRKLIPFPTNEQMVYDSGEDLKAKLKGIITQNKFRK